ncbi:hypothetical protein ACR9E3_06010 [Actinomycetospora sp. C-140]
MIKKLGVVTVGVAAGLVAVAPFASATESHHGGEHGHGHKDSGSCNVTGGDATANGGVDGDALVADALAQAPVGGANAANIVCNDILNGNLSGNVVDADILGGGLPELPITLPAAPAETPS